MIRRQYFYGLYACIVLAIIFAIVMAIIGSSEVKWIIPAICLALVSIGLGFSGFTIALHADSTNDDIRSLLKEMERKQEERYKELKEQTNSGSSIVASLEVMSKYYMDYINKQKEEDTENV